MKKIFVLFILIIEIFFSCKKELSIEGGITNQPPVADAGSDQVSVLPKDSVVLDGSASRDPDGTIVKYQWTRIDGPASARLALPDSVKSMARTMEEGVYHFQLEVTDDKGAHAQDTMQVTVVKSTGINQPPVAKAGADTTLVLPVNRMMLNGSSSYDPDGIITTWQWSKVSGPSSFLIDSAGAAQTKVSNLVAGVYLFELTVTDNNGLSAKDSIQVTISTVPVLLCDHSGWPVIAITTTPIGSLSEARVPWGARAALNKVVFAGGWKAATSCCNTCTEFTPGSSVADIYDEGAGSWQQHQLSQARIPGATAVVGNKILVAGGDSWVKKSSGEGYETYDNIDIYDASTNSWELAHLSTKRHYISPATIGDKVIFAGGAFYVGNFPTRELDASNAVDIYNASTGQWSVHTLSVARAFARPVVLDNKAYFIGGDIYVNSGPIITQAVDVYDNATGSWSVGDWQSVMTLLAPPAGLGQLVDIQKAADNLIFFAAGNKVGVRNLTTGKSSMACLPLSQTYYVNGTIVFYDGYNHLVFYDPQTTTWSQAEAGIPAGVRYFGVMLNNSLYIAGGIQTNSYDNDVCVFNDKVYKVMW